MRVAIVSDVHGNRRAFEAVLAELRQVAPDLVVQGGDLAYGGAHPVEIIDQIRALGWPGVRGNTDEMLWSQESLSGFAAKTQSDTWGKDSAWFMPARAICGVLPCTMRAMRNCGVRTRRLVLKSWSTGIFTGHMYGELAR